MTKWAMCPFCLQERPVIDGAFIKDHRRPVGSGVECEMAKCAGSGAQLDELGALAERIAGAAAALRGE
jgi:hypothetical protein